MELFPRLKRYNSENSFKAARLYNEIAQKNDLSLTQLSLAFVNDRPFVTSNIIGATTIDQLKENIDSIDVKLSDDTISEINQVNNKIPNPSP
jgi:aryl-alcohol dehydrogenase-like predicted oxidoreductase